MGDHEVLNLLVVKLRLSLILLLFVIILYCCYCCFITKILDMVLHCCY